MKYVFPPDRDVVVGFDRHCDIRLDRLDSAGWQSHPDVLLRFTGSHWVAIDRGRNGIFVEGARVATVDVRDGQAITVGDPRRGPRLVFQLNVPSGPPGPPDRPRPPAPPRPAPPPRPPARPVRPQSPPAEATQRIPEAGLLYPTMERPTRPIQLPPPAAKPPASPPAPAAEDEQPKSRGVVERVTDATRKLKPGRSDTGAEEVVPANRLPLKASARTIGVAAYQLGLTVDGHELLSDVSFTARPGSFGSVVGPSTARNSVLIGLLGGTRPLRSGVLAVDGHDVNAEHQSMRSRIGLVSRDDRVHRPLTVERALAYAAELRLPPATSPADRRRAVEQVLEELELAPHRKTRVAKLSPELRRCAAMAIELVTRPSLLVVDDPGSGLGPEQENHVMAMLRRQADLGCVVVVATTSLAHLHMSDQVLLLTPEGTMAFAGPPAQVESAMGTTDWSDIFARVRADPEGAHRAFLGRQQASPTAPALARPEPLPTGVTFGRQVRVVVRRQVRLLFAHRLYFLFLLILPFALGALTLLIPASSGLEKANPDGVNPHQAVEILAALNIAAVIMGTALTIRDLVLQRRMFRREQAVGLSSLAYLLGKVIVFSVVAAIQAAIVTSFVLVAKGGPVHGAVLLRNPDFELYVSVAVTAIVSAIVGLALSSLGRSLREVVPLVIPVMLASLLFAGGMLPLVGKWGFDQISWFVPAQWGFAASASTVDLHRVDRKAPPAAMWTHYVGWWVFDMIMLAIFGALWAGFVWYRLRLPRDQIRDQSLRHEQPEPNLT